MATTPDPKAEGAEPVIQDEKLKQAIGSHDDKNKKKRNTSLGKNLKAKWEKKTGDCTTSRYRGVTKHRRSGRWESHIWVAAKGKQIYLGGYELEEHAASAYDVARIKIKGLAAKTNFGLDKYDKLMPVLEEVSFDDLVTAVRRQSQGFAKCPSSVKWVSRHDSGKWEAKALVGSCSKFINLGLFDTEQQAIAAYHRAMAKMGTQGASKPAAQPASNAAMDYPAQYQQLNLSEAGQLAYAQMQAAAAQAAARPQAQATASVGEVATRIAQVAASSNISFGAALNQLIGLQSQTGWIETAVKAEQPSDAAQKLLSSLQQQATHHIAGEGTGAGSRKK